MARQQQRAARGKSGSGAREPGTGGSGARDAVTRSGGARRPPARRRQDPWKVAFVVLLVLGALGIAGWVLLGSRLLVVREVQVTGERLVSRDRVLAAARVPLGTPLLRVDPDVVRGRVESVTEVESAAVVRVWPARLRIAVRERTPVVVALYQGKYLHIDRYGVTVLGSAVAPAGLPQLRVASPGQGDPATRAALGVLGGLPQDIAGRLSAIEAASPESVTLRLRSGPAVVWGAQERTAEKLRALHALLGSERGERAKEIDVSSPEVVSTR